MNVKVIGIGAAGNKAAIELIESNVIPKEDIMLFNSTLKDIPTGYEDIAIQFSQSVNGCGKEREMAKSLILEALQNGTVKVDNLFEEEDIESNNVVIIVNSSEGGTGCGASSVLGQYFIKVLEKFNIHVHMVVFTGFEDDCRGLQNTVEYFQELIEDYSVQAISNKKFLAAANGNKMKAEKAANMEFVKRIKLMLGKTTVPSEQNIDDTELYKLISTPGFMTVEYAELDKIKNVEQFNKTVLEAIDNSKSLEITPSVQCLGVILNIHEKTRDSIDYSFTAIKNRLGDPYDEFPHVQSEEGPEYIAIIASGIKMPIDDIKGVYEKYKTKLERVNTTADSFFNVASDMKIEGSGMFNMKKKKTASPTVDKSNFFSSIINNNIVDTNKK